MKASPQVAHQIQDDTVTMVEASTAVKRGQHWRSPSNPSLKRLRTDLDVWVLLLAAIELAKSKRILSFTVDETECECESLQNIIVTFESASGEIKDIVLDGVVMLTDKTAATCADTVMETFDRTRRLLQEWVEKYVAAYTKHHLKALPADAETDEAAVAAEAKAHELNIFGDPTKVAFARVEAGGGDHCNGAKLGVRLCGEKGKSAEVDQAYPETQASHGSRLTRISKIRRAYQHAYPR